MAKARRSCGILVLLACLGARGQSPSASDDLATRLNLLQQQVQQLQAELAALRRAAPSASEPSPAIASGDKAAETVVQPKPADSTRSTAPSTGASTGSGVTFSGFADMYYGYDFAHPSNQTSLLRAFDGPTDQFSLNLVQVMIEKLPLETNSRTGFRLSLGFGNAMTAMNNGNGGFAQYLKEGYVSYLAPVGAGLQFDLGKFATPAGAEVIESKDDWNYSRGLLFTYAVPYDHFGLRAKYALGAKYSVTALLVNGWNNVIDNNGGKTAGVSFAWNPNRAFGVTQTYLEGPEQNGIASRRQLTDTVATWTPSSKLSLMANLDYGRGDRSATGIAVWRGVAGYTRYTFLPKTSVAARYEWFADPSGFTTGTAQILQSQTMTLERLLGPHFITRLEFRRDRSSETLVLGSRPRSTQPTIEVGVIYTFDSKEIH
jgi:hypothetical protein